MVDSRAKGTRGENLVKDLLIKHTKLPWIRTPLSGALDSKYGMKGDLMLGEGLRCAFCIEVKNYEESPFSDKILHNKSKIDEWWDKLVIQADEQHQSPLLFYRYNRSKIFVITEQKPSKLKKYLYIPWQACYIMIAEDWLEREKIKWQI